MTKITIPDSDARVESAVRAALTESAGVATAWLENAKREHPSRGLMHLYLGQVVKGLNAIDDDPEAVARIAKEGT